MNAFEINVRIGRSRVSMSRLDIELLLTLRRESLNDLAKRVPCARENLSRLLNGRAGFPSLKEKLATALEGMIAELPRGVAQRFMQIRSAA